MSQKELLPVGATLIHDGRDLRIVKRLSSGLTGEVYEAELVLPESPTPVRVAVKAMKALEFPMARQFFVKEGETLSFLMYLEDESNKSQRITLKVAPIYYGFGEYEETPYLVMEFISGEQLPSLLQKQGRLPESQALTIVWHLYRTLDILHESLKKTYIDLKFEDLWWVSGETEGGGQLKLTDFGTLEDIKPGDERKRGVKRDLLLGGVYFLSILTGYILGYSLGELKERAEPVIRKYEADVSWGTRQLLRRLLHRNPNVRPASAAEVARELRALVNFWDQPPERLFEMAQNNLAQAETAAETAKATKGPLSKEGHEFAIRAYAALDILRLSGSQMDLTRDFQRVQAVLSIGDYFERGIALLQGRSYTLARQTFEEGIQWSDDPAFLRRWAYLAQIGEEISPSILEANYNDAVKALESLNANHWDVANTRLQELSKALSSKGLECLTNETRFFDLVEKAEKARGEEKYDQAAEYYKQALGTLKKLPPEDARFIREEEVGDLSLFWEEMKTLAATREEANCLYQESFRTLQQGELEEALRKSWSAYETDRDTPFRFKALDDLAQQALEHAVADKTKFAASLHVARQLAEIGTLESPMDLALSVTYHLACNLDDAVDAISIRDGVEFRRCVEKAHTEAGEDALFKSVVQVMLQIASERAAESGSADFMRAAADLLEKYLGEQAEAGQWRTKADALEAQQIVARHKDIDGRLAFIRDILAPVSPKPEALATILAQTAQSAALWRGVDLVVLRDRLGRLEDASVRLAEARILAAADGYRLDEIDELESVVERGLADARKALATQEKMIVEERKKRIMALSLERVQLDTLRQWGQRAPEVQAGLDVQRSLHLQLRGKLSEFIYRCYAVLGGNKESAQETIAREQTMQAYGQTWEIVDELGAVKSMTAWATHALDELGAEAWDEVGKLAEEHKRQIEAEFQAAQAAFQSGELARLAAELERTEASFGANLEWQSLKEKFALVSAWKAWWETQTARFEEGHPDADLLRDLRTYLKLGLPELYWGQSPASAYLKKAAESARQSVSQGFKRYQEPEFIEKLRDWLNVEWTRRLAAPTPEKSRGKWDAFQWLAAAYQIAQRHNINQMAAFIADTPLPENIDAALHSFTFADWEKIRADEERRKRAVAVGKRILIAAPIGLTLCALLVVGGLFVYKANQDAVNQIIYGTYTPTLTPSPTLTPTPTTPTLTPTPAETPTPTLTPTLIPASQFQFAASELYPAIPLAGDTAWILNEDDATVEPPFDNNVWAKGYFEDPISKETYRYRFIKVGNATITWEMDQPFNAGLYQIYVLDTLKDSAGAHNFAVMLDGMPAQPYRGQSEVIFQDRGQRAGEWLPIGACMVGQGQKLSVHIALGPLTEETAFAIDRLLIVEVSEQQKMMLDQLPSGRVLVSLLDDDRALFYEVVGGVPLKVSDRGQQYSDAPAWNGSFRSRALAEPYAPIQVDWLPLGRLPAGTYELYVWIPLQHATVIADYALLADGVLVPRENPAQINQKDYADQWVTLGTWKLDAEAAVGVRMIVARGVLGDIGVDAVAVVGVGE